MAVQGEMTREVVRGHVHAMWASVADRWQAHADDADRRVAAVTRAMLARTSPQPGDHVLELACGPGGAGLAAAERVGPDGVVVLSDVVAEMVAIAAARAESGGLLGVRTAILDLEAIDQPAQSYDVVLCREGLMFVTEPDHAVAEIHRVLRRGGRAAVSVWGSPEQNAWLGLVFEAVTAQLGRPVPPPGMPGPFSLADPTRLAALFEVAGFADVVIEEIPAPLHAASFEAWWARTSALAGPIASIVAGLPDDTRRLLTERLRVAVEPYTTASGIELPGLALLVTARRP